MSVTIRHYIQQVKNMCHYIFPIIGVLRYGMMGNKISIIGITGTDGKSSSVILTASMLRAHGHKVAHYSSISFHDGDTEFPNTMKMTTPGRMKLHRFLYQAYKNGCTHAVIEVTSQGIMQHRHRFIGFSLIGITNITPEHIEAHGGFYNYKKTKLSLISQLKKTGSYGLVIDDETYTVNQAQIPSSVTVTTVCVGDNTLFASEIIEEGVHTSTVAITQRAQRVLIQSSLGGPFITHNIIFATTIAILYGVPLRDISEAVISHAHIPGRFEIVKRTPLVIVDYAHTINALTRILQFVRAHTKGKVVHVFGAAGGGRDRYKRPLIAELSEQYTDTSILTEENSFDEPIERILADIQKGFSKTHNVHVIPHREDAFDFALSLLDDGDTLLLTAKGSETVIAGPKGSKRAYTERSYIQHVSNDF